MLYNIYLNLIESIDRTETETETVIKINITPTFQKLNPVKQANYNYAQVQGDPKEPETRTYMGIVAQYESKTNQFTILETLMRNTHITQSFLKEHTPVIGD